MDEKDLERFMDYLYKELQLGNRTAEEYLYVYRSFQPLKLSQEYINDFVLEHKNTTIVRAFMKHYLEFHGISEAFTLPKRPRGRKPERVVRTISDNELNIVKEYFYGSSFKHGVLFDMIYQGAMRRTEVLTITLGSFFWNTWLDNPTDLCKVVILGKGKKQRIILINPETTERIANYYIKKYNLDNMAMIKEFMMRNKDILLFSKNGGEPLKEKDVYLIIKNLSKKALGRDIRPHELRHCVKADCEILTINGWKRYDNIKEGDKIFSYDIINNCIKKDKIKKINIYDFHGKINRIKNRWLDYCFTDEHNHVLNILLGKSKEKSKDYWRGYNKYTLNELEKCKNKRSIKHKVSAIFNGNKSIGIKKAGILGFILTDANVSNRNHPSISICQSEIANPQKCKYIEKLLIDGNVPFTKTTYSNYLSNFQILKGGNHSKNNMGINHEWIYEFIEKDRTPKWKLLDLKHSELKELYNCMMMGDGTRDSEFCNQNIKRIEFFRALCCLLGKNTILGKKKQNSKEYYRTYIQKKESVQIRKEHLFKKRYDGIVWCPITKNGTFIAKSNGKIFITGNSRASELEKRGASLRDIRNYLGHSKLATTEIYLHKTGEESIDAIKEVLRNQ